MYDLSILRQEEFPISANYIYFNHAGISPVPQRTMRKAQWAVEELAKHPSLFWEREFMPAMKRLQEQTAVLIGAHNPEEIVPITTTSMGLNMVAQAICWQPGDEILFCDLEFPSNAYPWMSLARDGVTVKQVPAQNGGATLEAIRPYVTEHTRLIAVSAIQFFSGHRTNLMEIGQFCHQHNILFAVDAIQAIGHMPINVQTMHIDILATGGQKSLLALPGTGFLYVRQAVAKQMQPRIIGSNATQNYLHWLHYDLTPANSALRFNSGTYNVPGIIAMHESITLLQELGITNIDQHTTSLTHHASAMLTRMGYEVITPQNACGPITTFRLQQTQEEANALIVALSQRHIAAVKHLDALGSPYLRISFHCYNTVEEVDQFGKILAELQ